MYIYFGFEVVAYKIDKSKQKQFKQQEAHLASLPIGIDLGTSNSVICVFENNQAKPIILPRGLSKSGTPLLPSLVGFDKKSSKIYVGHEATTQESEDDAFVREIKRQMGTQNKTRLGNQDYSPQVISAFILKRLKDYMIESRKIKDEREVNEAIISVPANFMDAQRQATLDAAKIAGFNVPMLIPEPTAAALAFGIDNLDIDEQIMVFDFGGGTLDISLLEMFEGVIDVKRVNGDSKLGGKDIDDILFNWVKSEVNKNHPGAIWSIKDFELRSICEDAKIRLSKQTDFVISSSQALRYKGESIPLEVNLSRQQFDKIISPILERAQICIENLLKGDGKINKRIEKSTIGRILMVGGSTYIPAVRDRVSDVMNRQVLNDVNPDLAVAIGACLRAAIYQGAIEPEKEMMLADISPFSVGVEVAELMNDRIISGIFSPLILQNAPIPTASTHQYSLMHTQQSSVNVKLYQGNSKYTKENELLSSVSLENIPPSLTDEPRNLNIDFKFDLSGIVTLNVGVEGTSIKGKLNADPRQGRLDSDQIIAAQHSLAHLNSIPIGSIDQSPSLEQRAEDSPNFVKVKAIVNRARKIIKTSSNPPMENALNNLYAAILNGNIDQIEDAEEKLTDIILDGNH